MATIIVVVVALVGVGGLGLVLRNYRRQSEWQEGPGKVPEDYS
jgi:ABC-type phosphate/phosphonate transport system permease subunit